jgi:hypothetical protein
VKPTVNSSEADIDGEDFAQTIVDGERAAYLDLRKTDVLARQLSGFRYSWRVFRKKDAESR